MFVREASALGPPTMTSEPWYAFLTLLRSYDSFRHCVFSLCLRHRHRLFIFLFSNSVMEKRVCTNGLTTTVNVPTFMLMSTEVLLMIMWYTPKQPTDQDAVKFVARQRIRLRHSGCSRLRDPPLPSQQVRIKPPQRRLRTLNFVYLDVKRPHGWTKRS